MITNNYDRAKLELQTFSIVRDRAAPAAPIHAPEDVAPALVAIFDQLDHDREHFVVLALNSRNEPIGYKVVSSGTASACVVHPREVFRAALFLGASGMMCAHNHPSGHAEPSPEDLKLGLRINEAGKIMGIPVLDHFVVVTSDSTRPGTATSYQKALERGLGDSK